VYIEGVDFAYNHHTTELFTFFGCNFIATGGDTNVQTLTGSYGTLAETYEFSYQYGSDSDYQVDEISANCGSLIFTSQDGIGRGVCFDGDEHYHTIFTSTLLGSMIDGEYPNTKAELMGSYLDYLTQPVVSVDDPDDLHVSLVLNNHPNPFSRTTTISLSGRMPLYDSYQISIYNIKGECVRELKPHSYDINTIEVEWNGKDNMDKDVNSGLYFYSLKINGKTIAINKCLLVNQ